MLYYYYELNSRSKKTLMLLPPLTCLSPLVLWGAEIEEDDQLFNLALESRNHAVERIKQSQQQLIVVASLVDRIPNLAGLTRTCEV